MLESRALAQSTIDALSSNICVLDETGSTIAVNQAWTDFANANRKVGHRELSDESLFRSGLGVGGNYLYVCDHSFGEHAEEASEFARGMRAVLSGECETYSKEYPCDSPIEKRWFLGKVTRFFANGLPRIVVEHINITDRKQIEEALSFKTALLEAQTESSLDGILVTDESNHIILANKQFALSFGVTIGLFNTGDDVLFRKYAVDTFEDPAAFLENISRLKSHRTEKSRDELRLKNGKIFDRYSAPLVDSAGKYRGRVWYHRDITDRKAAEDRIQFLAYHDALTELPQRALLADRLENALSSAQRRNERVALLFLDLDQFKDLNDTFGHSFGDSFLKAFAKRLRGCVRAQDTVARLGGDEFLIMLTGVKDAAAAAVTAEHVMDAMKASLLVEGQSLHVGCSIGISVFPEHGADGETLIKNADAAMYSAKGAGRGQVRFFTDEMDAQALKRLSIKNNLLLALERQEFFLVYQPQMDIESGSIVGVEALIRWQSPEMGLVLPNAFISIAENCGLILPIGEWVLRTACAQVIEWQKNGLLAVPVAVNVSAVQFRQEGFLAVIRNVLLETGLAPQYLELELTESILLSHADLAFSTLQDLKDLGLKLAIDDFGAGYSSLSYLKQFPVSKLKIDRSFIQDLAVDPDYAAITIAIISMAKSLHLKVIAEGVETEAQMRFLREHRCDEIQGYYFSLPITADQVADILACSRGHAEDGSDAGDGRFISRPSNP